MAKPSPVTTFLIRHPSTWRFLTFSSGLTLSDAETPNGLGEPPVWQFGPNGTILNCRTRCGFEPTGAGFTQAHNPKGSGKARGWHFTRSGRIQHISSGLVLVAAVTGMEYVIKVERWMHENMAQQWQIVPLYHPIESIYEPSPFMKFVIRHPSTCRFLTVTNQSVSLSDPETPEGLEESEAWHLGQGEVIMHNQSNHYLTYVSNNTGHEIKTLAAPEIRARFAFSLSGRIQVGPRGRVLAATVTHDRYEVRLENWVDGNMAQQWQLIPFP